MRAERASIPLALLVLVFYCSWSNRIGVFAREITNKRKLLASDCSGARVECTAYCGSDGVDDFVCDEAGLFTDGSWYCLCESSSPLKCFSGSSTVLTETGKHKAMQDLKLGDRVLSVNANGQPVYSPVYLFSSYRPGEISSFVRVSTDAGLNVTVTPGHYLFVHRGSALEAANRKRLTDWKHLLPSQVRIGDYVPIIKNSGDKKMTVSRVKSIEQVHEVGVFMPHTLMGAIVVDGVVASELTEFVPRWAVGHRFQRVFNAFVATVLAVIPRGWEENILNTVSTIVHGQTDIQLNRDAFLSGFVRSS